MEGVEDDEPVLSIGKLARHREQSVRAIRG